jgi:sorting nexin-29
MLRGRSNGVMDAVHELIIFIWTTENMPQEWNTGIIYPIYKKGDILECNNYRRITLLNNAYKIFSSILNEGLKIATDKIAGQYQCGLGRNKSTIDQLFILRQMIEEHKEHCLDLRMLFIGCLKQWTKWEYHRG